MKKFGLLTTLLGAGILLTGCNCNVNVTNDCNSLNEASNEAKAICLENKGTYLWSTSPVEEHGECMFPSGVGCRDDMILNGECDWEPNLSEIDTAEERQIGCENNVDGWMQDMVGGAIYHGIEWDGDEEEIEEDGKLVMIVRNFYAKYDKDGKHWKLQGRCEANFVDGSLGTTYGDEYEEE